LRQSGRKGRFLFSRGEVEGGEEGAYERTFSSTREEKEKVLMPAGKGRLSWSKRVVARAARGDKNEALVPVGKKAF